MTVQFETRREDFPPNIEDLKADHLILYFAGLGEDPSDQVIATLRFKEQGQDNFTDGAAAQSIDGVISTRGNAVSSWKNQILPATGKPSPVGVWEITLPNTDTLRNQFENEDIEDMLFVITYSGRTPEWPA